MRVWLAMCVALLAGGGAAAKKKAADEKVKIAVYYEALCPDSKTFIVSQLAPVWKELRGAIKVKLVPYGKANQTKKDSGWEFTCQHGPAECYGNKVQACILKDKNLVDTDKVDLVVCLMGQQAPDTALQTCAEKQKKSSEFGRLKECADSKRGGDLLAANGDKTNAVQSPLASVPTVVINESLNSTNQLEAITNLKSVVCAAATTKPSACT